MKYFLLFPIFLALSSPTLGQSIPVGAFSSGDFSGWTEKSFKGHTIYEVVKDQELRKSVVRAQTQDAASGRFKKITIDLSRTPILNWSWKIEKPYTGIDENTKAGDDFPVRVYVVVERGFLGLSTKALNYVWASKNLIGASWSNPFTSQARMLAVNSGAADTGTWVAHKRNVRDDLKAAFGEDFTEIHLVAIMTDGDNSGQQARAWYGDISFSEK
ncbi:MAG: hypothetical protein A3I66_15380 [Burkholderiales bacterium RIFCSPLOWO2_02_FULL_57_36]|nr:MAG: hypothetical protein A3I66_15380 [Burkholderiales bacterium RIFCSPLOWO2_02_FULL_57_36]